MSIALESPVVHALARIPGDGGTRSAIAESESSQDAAGGGSLAATLLVRPPLLGLPAGGRGERAAPPSTESASRRREIRFRLVLVTLVRERTGGMKGMRSTKKRGKTLIVIAVVPTVIVIAALALIWMGKTGPDIPHRVDGQSTCTSCHVLVRLPENHRTRTDDSCLGCHSAKAD